MVARRTGFDIDRAALLQPLVLLGPALHFIWRYRREYHAAKQPKGRWCSVEVLKIILQSGCQYITYKKHT